MDTDTNTPSWIQKELIDATIAQSPTLVPTENPELEDSNVYGFQPRQGTGRS